MSTITTYIRDGFLFLELPDFFYMDSLEDFEKKSLTSLTNETHCVIFDFVNCKKIHFSTFPVIAKYKVALKKTNVSLYSLNVSEEIKASFIKAGLDNLFSPESSFQAVQDKVGFKATTNKIFDAEMINFILSQVSVSFKGTFEEEAKPDKPVDKSTSIGLTLGVVSSLDLSESETFGIIRIYYPENFILKLQIEKHQNFEPGISQKSIKDFELLCESFFIAMHTELQKKKYQMKRTFPSVMIGILSQLAPHNKKSSLCIPYNTKFGQFILEIIKAY